MVSEKNFWVEFLISFCNYSTIGLCIICKIPQIWSIVKSKSVSGCSLNSTFVELTGYLIVMCYNVVKGYPLLAYSEYIFLVIQDVILILLIFHHSNTLSATKVSYVGFLLSGFQMLTMGYPHPAILLWLISLVPFVSAWSKVLQLREIWSSRNSNSVSVTTWTIAAYTCITRIVTTLLETGDLTLLVNFSIALLLNTAIVLSTLKFKVDQKLK